jgi:hypothetical protein
MTLARRLCAFIPNDDPASMRRLNGWLTIFWVVMIPGHWSAWQAARAEVAQAEESNASGPRTRAVQP